MKKTRIIFQIDPRYREELIMISEKNKRSLSDVIRLIIEDYLATKRREQMQREKAAR